MKYYFILQWKMLNRYLDNFGLNIYLAYPALLVLFVLSSVYFLKEVQYASYLYALIPLIFIGRLSGRDKNDFLITCFSNRQYLQVRMLEHLIICLPFLIFLWIKAHHIESILLLFSALGLALFNPSKRTAFVLPTAFKKNPFEFIVGFRKSIVLLSLLYLIGIIAVVVDNFNLGMVSLYGIFISCFSFYLLPEKKFYVWISNTSPKKFLIAKAQIALLYSSYLTLPFVILLSAAFPESVWAVLLLQCIGYLVVFMGLCSKYANYPDEIILPESMMMILCIVFPPLLLAMIPYFYIKSQQKLKEIL